MMSLTLFLTYLALFSSVTVIIWIISFWKYQKKEKEIVDVVSDAFIEIFNSTLRYHHPTNDLFDKVGQYQIRSNIKYWMNQNEAIHCCFPAFSFKSPNNIDKVFGIYPDYGEYLALKSLYDFACKVSKIYDKGCIIIILGDGRLYSDLLGVTAETVVFYNDELMKMIEKNNWQNCIKISHLVDDLNIRQTDTDKYWNQAYIVNKLIDGYGPKSVKNANDENEVISYVNNVIKTNNEIKSLYLGMSRFLEYDLSPWNTNKFVFEAGESICSVKKCCARLTKFMIFRCIAYQNLISKHYSNYVRLSIHNHNNSKKFGVCLFERNTQCVAPWHNVTVLMLDGRILIMKRKIIEYIVKVKQIDFEKMHAIDRKHNKEWIKTALKFDQWSLNCNSKKTFEIVYNCDNDEKIPKLWYYREM